MSTRATHYLHAINRLPNGATLTFSGVKWREYEQLLSELSERSHVRINYDDGRLDVVSPSPEHDYYGRFIDGLIQVVAEELNLEIQAYGSATWKRKALRKGAEADACYYIANAKRVIGRVHIDLESDPPPDVAVEIEITCQSSAKLPIYAALGVPELWTYDGNTVHFYGLSATGYQEIPKSQWIPDLVPELLRVALHNSKTQGQTAALRMFRQELRSRRT